MKSDDLRNPTNVLANERTYLAYIRTAVAFIAFGFVIARFSLFTHEISIIAHLELLRSQAISAGLGTAMAIFGIIVGAFGAYRYTIADRRLREGSVSAMHPFVATVGAFVLAAAGLLVAITLTSARP